MTFGEKVKEARLALNLSQTELAQITGLSERSLYTYEQLGTIPRKSNVRKLSEALNVTTSYLLNDDETDKQSPSDEDMFAYDANATPASIAARQAQDIIRQTKALLTSDLLDDNEKDVFFRALMAVYLQHKRSS